MLSEPELSFGHYHSVAMDNTGLRGQCVDALGTCLSSRQHRQEKVNLEKLDLSCGHRTPDTAGLTVIKTWQVSFPFSNNHKHLFGGRLCLWGSNTCMRLREKYLLMLRGSHHKDKHLGSWDFYFFMFIFLVLVLALHRPRRRFLPFLYPSSWQGECFRIEDRRQKGPSLFLLGCELWGQRFAML